VSPDITMTGAISALVAEKRATGCKYDAEERVLARFAAFSASQFPGLRAPTRTSVEAWITAARSRGVKPATLQGLAALVRELARRLAWVLPAWVLPAGALPRPAAQHVDDREAYTDAKTKFIADTLGRRALMRFSDSPPEDGHAGCRRQTGRERRAGRQARATAVSVFLPGVRPARRLH
jgi:hypothetical protein